jgi:hypothetical protein
MGDGGKTFTMRTLVMSVGQWAELGYGRAEIILSSWAVEARNFLEWSSKDEFPAELHSCNGTANWDALIQLLGENPDGKVLLFTDGFWPQGSAKVFKRWKECLPLDTIRIIKIGSDANPHLKGPDVFASEDFLAALDDWLGASPT